LGPLRAGRTEGTWRFGRRVALKLLPSELLAKPAGRIRARFRHASRRKLDAARPEEQSPALSC
jgi:hypothetical protein